MNHIKNPPIAILVLLFVFIVLVAGSLMLRGRDVDRGPDEVVHICDTEASKNPYPDGTSCRDGYTKMKTLYSGEYSSARFELIETGAVIDNSELSSNKVIVPNVGESSKYQVWIYTIDYPIGMVYEGQEVKQLHTAIDKYNGKIFTVAIELIDGQLFGFI